MLPVEETHASILFELLRNDAIKRYLLDNREIEEDFVLDVIRKSQRLFEEQGIGLWLIHPSNTKTPIGVCGFVRSDTMELLYVIHPTHQGNGYATEAASKALSYYLELGFTEAIHARIDEPNVESHAVAKRLNMTLVGTQRNATTGGTMLVYRITP
jgi:ribosomal-protein-alanine N-acetyltransferase